MYKLHQDNTLKINILDNAKSSVVIQGGKKKKKKSEK